MNYLKSKTVVFNVILAICASINAFVPFIPKDAVSFVLGFSAIIGLILRILTVVPLSDK